MLKADNSAIRELQKCDPDSAINITNGAFVWEKNFKSMSEEEMISAYGFNEMKYTEIKNLNEPVINISADGMMAYEYGKTHFAF